MPNGTTLVKRRVKAIDRRLREWWMIGYGLISTGHPVLAHLIVTRRCNLACGYCSEYDKTSRAVALDLLKRRIDRLADLGTTIVTLSGGEPLLHPDLDDVIRHVRSRRAIAGLITNGYLLTAERIRRLNRAGLDHMQISIDNVNPGPVSKKSLKVLDPKLRLLADHALFHVNVNSVIGSGDGDPRDALTVGHRAVALGFTSTVGILHDSEGQMRPLSGAQREVYLAMRALAKTNYSRFNKFQDNVADGRQNEWKCRAGARYLYICEDGLVHYCSQQRGYPAGPLESYSRADIKREFRTEKSCAPNCTVSCVHQVSLIDGWRAAQRPARGGLVEIGAAASSGRD